MTQYDFMQEQRDWNMAVAFLQRLDRRLEDCNMARSAGNLLKWYRSLMTIYSMIHFKIKEEGHEKKEDELEKKFDKMKNLFMSPATRNKILNQQFQTLNMSQLEIDLNELEIIMNDLLYAYELIFGKKKRKLKPEEAIRDNF